MGNIHLKYLKEGSCRAYIGISIVDQNEHLAILLVLQKAGFQYSKTADNTVLLVPAIPAALPSPLSAAVFNPAKEKDTGSQYFPSSAVSFTVNNNGRDGQPIRKQSSDATASFKRSVLGQHRNAREILHSLAVLRVLIHCIVVQR